MSERMVFEKSWEEFRESKLLWWVNRSLHLFGWAIICNTDEDGHIINTYPARVKFRGFDNKFEDEGFQGLSDYIKENIEELQKEAYED
jgi:hypothetical protein